MAERTWFGNHGVVKFALAGNTPAVVSLAKDLEVTATGEYEELYALGSTLRQDVAIHTKKATVKFKIMKFDPANCDLWMMLDPDHMTGDYEMAPTSKVQLYDVEVYLDRTSSAGDNVKLTITDVYFENLPFSVNETEWIGIELDGVGAGLTLSNEAYTP